MSAIVGAVGAPEDDNSGGLVGLAKKSTAPPIIVVLVVVIDGVGVEPAEGAITEIAGTLVAAALACLSFFLLPSLLHVIIHEWLLFPPIA